MKLFFLTTNPGLESAAHLELNSKWGRAPDFLSLPDFPDIQRTKGGIEFEAPLEWGLNLALHLRMGTRLLLRLAKFQCEHQRDLLAELKKIQWQELIDPTQGYNFKLTSKSSRISKNDQIEKVLQKVLKPLGLKKKEKGAVIYIRLLNDECNISLDCTGEGTYKRGENKKGSIASLRSSIASGLLRLLLQGIDRDVQLIDPMCGAGTFIDEACNMNQAMNRKFACQKFPCYESLELKALPESTIVIKQAYGFDLSEKALEVAKKNLSFFDHDSIVLRREDLFDPNQGVVEQTELMRVMVLNPPWGKRLPGSSQDLLKTVYEKYQPDRLGVLIPAHWKMSTIPMEKIRDISLINSGVKNRFLIYSKGLDKSS